MFGIAAAVAGLAGVMYTDQSTELSYGHGLPRSVLRRLLWSAAWDRSQVRFLPGSFSAFLKLCFDERSEDILSWYRPDYHLSRCHRRSADAPRGLMGRAGMMED